jgi:hypothetical protein
MVVIKSIAGTRKLYTFNTFSLNSQHWSLCERRVSVMLPELAGLVEGASHGTHPSLMDFL